MLGLCERFGCLPSALYAEDTELLRMVKIQAAGRQEAGDG